MERWFLCWLEKKRSVKTAAVPVRHLSFINKALTSLLGQRPPCAFLREFGTRWQAWGCLAFHSLMESSKLAPSPFLPYAQELEGQIHYKVKLIPSSISSVI